MPKQESGWYVVKEGEDVLAFFGEAVVLALRSAEAVATSFHQRDGVGLGKLFCQSEVKVRRQPSMDHHNTWSGAELVIPNDGAIVRRDVAFSSYGLPG
jgi:hypothetical protein